MNHQAIANILNDDSFKEAMDELVKMHLDMLINSDVDDKIILPNCQTFEYLWFLKFDTLISSI